MKMISALFSGLIAINRISEEEGSYNDRRYKLTYEQALPYRGGMDAGSPEVG